MTNLFQILNDLKQEIIEKEETLEYMKKYHFDILEKEQYSFLDLTNFWDEILYDVSFEDIVSLNAKHLKEFYSKLVCDIKKLENEITYLNVRYLLCLKYIIHLGSISFADLNTLLFLQGLDYDLVVKEQMIFLIPKDKTKDHFYLYAKTKSNIPLFISQQDQLEMNPIFLSIFDENMIEFLYYYVNYKNEHKECELGILDIYFKYQSFSCENKFLIK